jgi:hypothetical protein
MPNKQISQTEYATISAMGKSDYNVGIPYKLSLKPNIQDRLPTIGKLLGPNNWRFSKYAEASYFVFCALELKKKLKKNGEY